MAAGHSPMAQFEVHKLIPLEIGGVDVSFTNASLWMALGGCCRMRVPGARACGATASFPGAGSRSSS